MTEAVARKFVPLADPHGEAKALRREIEAAFMRVVDGGSYILGPEVEAFESAMAKDVGVASVLGVASGTDALVIALLGLEVGPGDEVVTVSHTAGPTVAAIRMIGATPVLVDVTDDTYCIDPAKIAGALSPRTKAVIAVHLYGHGADMAAVKASAGAVPVIEDCAQAQGGEIGNRPVGSLGAVACFSFYPTKNLGAIGDGGAVATDSAALAERMRMLRTYGWRQPQYAEIENGRCSRLDELQAALLSVKLRHLAQNVERRRAIAARYRDGLKGLPLVLPHERESCKHAYHLYVIRCPERDALQAHLKQRDIGTGRHYPHPVHRQPGLAAKARIPAPLTVTERIAGEILSLPMFATMTDDQTDRVIGEIRAFYG